MEVKELIDRLSTSGDVGTAAISYVTGYLVAPKLLAFQSLVGVPRGTIALLAAITAIGVKNSIQALSTAVARKKTSHDPLLLEAKAEALRRYVNQIIDRSETPNRHPLLEVARELEEQLQAWRAGVTETEEFARYLKDASQKTRLQLKAPPETTETY